MDAPAYRAMLKASKYLRYEYMDSYAYAYAGMQRRHAAISGHIMYALGTHMKDYEQVGLFTSQILVIVKQGCYYFFPDASVTDDPADFENEDASFIRYPKLVIEVVTELSAKEDYGVKLEAYKQLKSLREIVLVSGITRRVDLYSRVGKMWENAISTGDSVYLFSIEATLNFDDIYEDVLLSSEEQ